MVLTSQEIMDRVDYRILLQELFCSIDEYTFSRVVQVTPKFKKFINDAETIRLKMKSGVDTRDDGK